MTNYFAFARQAIASDSAGILLDAGCGSLLFTAQTYLECQRPILACDQSLEMLRRAKSRLRKLTGSVPENIFLLQADLGVLPFRPASFRTTLCMNVLHHFPDAEGLLRGLKTLLSADGQLYLTSLVKSSRLIGDHYLNALHRRGDLVRPRTAVELETLLAGPFAGSVSCRTEGNMAYATAVRES